MTKDLTMAELGDLVDKISDALRAGKFGKVNRWLEADPKHMAEVEMVAYMRVPFMARDKLSNWKSFVRKVRDEIDIRGQDGDKFCQGLL
jgi:hypothetical protein